MAVNGYKALTEFFPTPPELIAKMIGGLVGKSDIRTILEPSAGKGDIVDFFALANQEIKGRYFLRLYDDYPDLSYEEVADKYILDYVVKDYKNGKRINTTLQCDCVEIDQTLSAILRDKKYNVYNEDFLTFNEEKHYDLILMNPPFSNGDSHLLKAINIAEKTGSKIVCLLNAETIRNPYSNKRKELIKKLEEYHATYEFIQDAFVAAERKTDVEIVLIKVDIPKPYQNHSRIWEELDEMDVKLNDITVPTDIIPADDPLRMAVMLYKRELEAGKMLIEEYLSLQNYIGNAFEGDQDSKEYEYKQGCILTLYSDTKKGWLDWNDYLSKLRYKYWYELLHNPVFIGNLTSNVRDEYFSMIEKLSMKDFSLKNIYAVKMDIINRTAKGIEDKIVSLFEELTYKHSMEAKGNVHLFSGWKSNSAFKINRKIVMPYANCWDTIFNKFSYSYSRLSKLLDDLEKCLGFLDIDDCGYHIDLNTALSGYQQTQQTKKLTFKYFDVDVFKKGTAHITFRNPELLQRFNLYGCMHKGWLPPSYGKKSYKEMTEEEKTVIDNYEGELEYSKVFQRPDQYILSPENSLLLLGAGA